MNLLQRITILFLAIMPCFTCAGQIKVAFFLSPTCMICRYYALEMRAVSAEYSDRGVEFIGYAVGPLLNDSLVNSFRGEYKIPFPVRLDDEMHRKLNATVTPEVFVIRNDSVMYHGRIDDSFVRVGKQRAHVKNRELRSALEKILQGQQPEVSHVPAVGCIIEK
jgi:hypothetical protein